jgi:hypothetical protein
MMAALDPYLTLRGIALHSKKRRDQQREMGELRAMEAVG